MSVGHFGYITNGFRVIRVTRDNTGQQDRLIHFHVENTMPLTVITKGDLGAGINEQRVVSGSHIVEGHFPLDIGG